MNLLVLLSLLLSTPTAVLVPQAGGPKEDFAFSADDTLLASADGTLWETGTGRMIWSTPIDPKSVAISDDGNKLLFCGEPDSQIWDRRTHTLLGKLSSGQSSAWTCTWARFLGDGQTILTQAGMGGLSFHNTVNYRADRKLTAPGKLESSGVGLMPDGKSALTTWTKGEDRMAGKQKSYVGVTSLSGFTMANPIELPSIGLTSVSVARDGKRAVVSGRYDSYFLDLEKNLRVHSVDEGGGVISPDGRTVVTFVVSTSSRRISVHDFESAAERTSRPLDFLPTRLGFNHAGDRLAVLSSPRVGRLALLDTATFETVRVLGKARQDSRGLAFSADGRHLAVAGGAEGVVRVWDLGQGRLESILDLKELAPGKSDSENEVINVEFIDQDGALVIGQPQQVVVLDREPPRVRHQFKARGSFRMQDFAVDRVGGLLALHPERDKFELVGLRGGEVRASLATRHGGRLLFAPGSKQLLAVAGPETVGAVTAFVERWNLETREPLAVWSYQERGADRAALVSPDGKTLAIPIPLATMFIDLESGRRIDTFFSPTDRRGVKVATALSPGGAKVLHVHDSGEVVELGKGDSKPGTTLGRLVSTRTSDVRYHPKDPDIVAFSGGFVRLCNLAKKSCASLLSSGDEWGLFSDDGLFDASPNGAELVAMVNGSEVYAVDQFATLKNRPDLILSQLGLGDAPALAYFSRAHERRRKKLAHAGSTEDLTLPFSKIAALKVEAASAELAGVCGSEKAPAASAQVFVNGVPVAAAGIALAGGPTAVKQALVLQDGLNRIELSCFAANGIESIRALREVTARVEAKPDLYFLGFGVSAYARPDLRLKYAAKDALDLEAAFKGMSASFGKVYTKVLTDAAVSEASIKGAKSFAARAREQDSFVVFIAGHGMHDESQTPQYYYLTPKSDPFKLAGSAVPFETIEDLLRGIRPRNKLFLMDTCESGEVEEPASAPAAESGLRARNARGLRKLRGPAVSRDYLLHRDRFLFNDLARRSGAIVFSSSRGGEYSYETEELQNGVFTESILVALQSPSADVDRNGLVSTEELRRFVMKDVEVRTKGLQHPVVDRDNLYARFAFPLH